ncbi:ethanolamine ammonia-lyase subunit EutC [Granulicella sibirica]|uniref:ethanolamine ammonia-lyase subunit EutC n=1 Tax=Granulicella sibirica TaxID=2479048 RepID=UPI0010087B3C|nr:ethanolamine ammonia-lyase subunit EutC [Granulicella sibirica]
MSDLTRPGRSLRDLTPARISLGRTGSSLTTAELLDFSLSHAQARDAVHATLSLPTLLEELTRRGLKPIAVRSAAPDRPTYLRRPDLGRKLSETSTTRLGEVSPTVTPSLAFILADGLSALAVDRHAIPLIDALLPHLNEHFAFTPVVIAEQARVALGDEIAPLLHAQLTIMLIGERPGLSSPDSLGAYITWHPRPGRTDAERNCISNIRTQGLDYATAAAKIAYLCLTAQRLGFTGTQLKEAAPDPQQLLPSARRPPELG